MELFPEDLPQRPPIADAPLSVILLAADSTADTAESVSTWQAHLATLGRPVELLLLPLVPLEPLEPNPVLADLRQLAYDPAVGLGPALHAAYAAAQHPLVALATADRQWQPADLAPLFRVIDQVDLAVGCRAVAPRPWWWRAVRWLLGWLGWLLVGLPHYTSGCTPGATPWRHRWVARWLFGVRLTDPESCFRLARRTAMTRILLQARGPFALVEQLAKANHLEMILAEEPVAWTPPLAALPEPASFGADARALFRHPDFGPPELHLPPPEEKAPQVPTEASAESSEPGTGVG